MLRQISAIFIVSMAFASVSIAQDAAVAQEEKTITAAPVEVAFTLEQLATYNGKDGKPAYIAVDGVVYDVAGVKVWQKGEHKGGKVGTDISEKINKAPHKKKVLSKLTKVGVLTTEKAPEQAK
jgi:predicted heme/steroid binding protein